MLCAEWQIGIAAGLFGTALALGAVLLVLTGFGMCRPNPRLFHALYKFASLYMLGSMELIIAGAR